MNLFSFRTYLLALLLMVALYLPGQLLAQVCAGNFTLSNQAQVDAFNCTSITGSLFIFGTAINNLDGLSGLTTIGGDLYLSSNVFLMDLDGLSNLTSIGGVLTITNHASLMNVDGLSRLTSVGRDMLITSNGSLKNVDGLSSLDSVGGNLFCQNNGSLPNVNGFYNLSTVGGLLAIENNSSMTGFCGLYRLLKSGGPTGAYFVRNNAQNPTQADILSGGPCPGVPVPTLSEWGLIFLALFLLAFGVVTVEQRTLALAGTPVAFQQQGFSVDAKRWLSIWVGCMVLAIGVFGLAVVFGGYEMTAADFCCTPLAAAVGAYIIVKLR